MTVPAWVDAAVLPTVFKAPLSEPWMRDTWLPGLSEAFPPIDRLRASHLTALTEWRAAFVVACRLDGTSATLGERSWPATSLGDWTDEFRAAWEAEARALLALCDVVERCGAAIVADAGELDAFVVGREQRARSQVDAQAVRAVLFGFRFGGDANLAEGVKAARAQARVTLDAAAAAAAA